MIHSTGKDRERLTGDESVGRFSILSVYHVQKLASDKAQNLQSDGKASINQKLHSKERKIMATMYVCNIPTNETVNLRKKSECQRIFEPLAREYLSHFRS